MATHTFRHYKRRSAPYQIAAAATIAVAISFAAGAASVSALPAPGTEPVQAHLPPVYIEPFDYFPNHYENHATEVEPMPPTF